ncbi:MAG: hypothetical protein MK110_19525 [Fuerstiella sp.]|nr:hypothetical protein [Fuerstiella sp.]
MWGCTDFGRRLGLAGVSDRVPRWDAVVGIDEPSAVEAGSDLATRTGFAVLRASMDRVFARIASAELDLAISWWVPTAEQPAANDAIRTAVNFDRWSIAFGTPVKTRNYFCEHSALKSSSGTLHRKVMYALAAKGVLVRKALALHGGLRCQLNRPEDV